MQLEACNKKHKDMVVNLSFKPCLFAHRAAHMNPRDPRVVFNARFNIRQTMSQSDRGAVYGYLLNAKKEQFWTIFQSPPLLWLFGQFRWSFCNKLAIFLPDTSISSIPVRCLNRRLLLKLKGGGCVKHTFMGGLSGHVRDCSRVV